VAHSRTSHLVTGAVHAFDALVPLTKLTLTLLYAAGAALLPVIVRAAARALPRAQVAGRRAPRNRRARGRGAAGAAGVDGTLPDLERPRLEPCVYVHLTDNWNELTLRFLAREHGVRDLKNRISRAILEEFTAAKIEVASSTMDVTLMPSPPPRAPASLSLERS